MSNDVALVGQDRQTFYASVGALPLAASAGDVFTLTGAAQRRIRPVRLGFSGLATAAEAISVLLVKRSAQNTGGTSIDRFAVPASSRYPPAKGTVRAYTGNPTLGAAVGVMMALRDSFTTAAGAIEEHETILEFSGHLADIELLSEQEVLAINLSNATIAGGLLSAWICWTEEELV